jgi:CelD/BcsL family acetyltransferase involved in cellulose biosynthesis
MSHALLDRPVSAQTPALVGETVDFDWLRSRTAAWDRLAERALDPNPFFTRPVLGAHAEHGIASAGLRVLTVRRGENLAALLPFRPGGTRLGFGPRANVAWTSPYVTNATPLVAADALPEVIDALLDAMACAASFRFWMIPLLALDSPVAAAVQASAERRGWPFAILSGFERPALIRRRDYDTYARAHLKPNRRKSLARRRRRLAERGRLTFESVADDASLARAVESFLALELRGWKGTRGTALGSRHHTAAFARALFGRRQDGGVSPRADILSLDDRPIAVSLALVCGGAAHLLKTAYDESLRTLAPGLVLEDEIIRALHATAFAARLDTASVPGSVLDEIYGDRIRMGDLILAADARMSPETFAATVRRETGRRAALSRLKDLVRLLRR